MNFFARLNSMKHHDTVKPRGYSKNMPRYVRKGRETTMQAAYNKATVSDNRASRRPRISSNSQADIFRVLDSRAFVCPENLQMPSETEAKAVLVALTSPYRSHRFIE